MKSIFCTIGIVGNYNNEKNINIYLSLYYWLKKQGILVIIEKKIAKFLTIKTAKIGNLNEIGKLADLAIIIGGDGNMLRAANTLARYNIQIIGINQGNLGFLTDLDPNSAIIELSNILKGDFFHEKRFLLEVKIKRHKFNNQFKLAINEILFHADKITYMINFIVYIDNKFTFSQHADGLIIATPTGSTAYSLSAGGPIINPAVNAIILIPMLPHTLSSRPLIIKGNSIIKLKFPKLKSNLNIHCDNQKPISLYQKDEIYIYRSKHYINLIHPNNYNYFNTLNKKLGWFKKTFK